MNNDEIWRPTGKAEKDFAFGAMTERVDASRGNRIASGIVGLIRESHRHPNVIEEGMILSLAGLE